MSNVSSRTLFHFTSTKDNLISILRNEFYPSFSLETQFVGDYQIQLAIPMVSFCDIPLSQVKNHLNVYGFYGLGMTKEWADRNALNPVFYIRRNSIIAQNLLSYFNSLPTPYTRSDLTDQWYRFTCFLKPYQGKFQKRDKSFDEYSFYDEKEWRYIPPDLQSISRPQYENPETLSKANQSLKNQKLTFEPDDIKYIILKNDDEIHDMQRSVRDIKGSKYAYDTVDKLTSRIITSQQIIHDF